MILFYLTHLEWLPTALRIQSPRDSLQGPIQPGPCPPDFVLQASTVFTYSPLASCCFSGPRTWGFLLATAPAWKNISPPDHQRDRSAALFRSQLQGHLPRKAFPDHPTLPPSAPTVLLYLVTHCLSAPFPDTFKSRELLCIVHHHILSFLAPKRWLADHRHNLSFNWFN